MDVRRPPSVSYDESPVAAVPAGCDRRPADRIRRPATPLGGVDPEGWRVTMDATRGPRRRLRGALAALGCTVAWIITPWAAAAAHGDDPPGPTRPIDDPIPGHIERGAIQGQLQTLAEGAGLTAPNYGTSAPGQPGTLYVVDQDGPLWAIDLATGRKTVALNTRSLLVQLFPGDERGF